MIKENKINPFYANWINITLAILCSIISFFSIIFYEYNAIITWSLIFTFMLINLLISYYIIFLHLKTDNFNYKKNIVYILELATMTILVIISFSLMMFSFYSLILLITNIIYTIYLCCILERRADIGTKINEVI